MTMMNFGLLQYCYNKWGQEEERKEPEVSSYTKSAEIAGKLLKHMEEAGCRFPSVHLYGDGSGHFVLRSEDKKIGLGVLDLYMPGVSFSQVLLTSHFGDKSEFAFNNLKEYTSVCYTCKRPLEEENE